MIPISGYTPGQTINVVLSINNKSSQIVDSFIVILYMVIESQFVKKSIIWASDLFTQEITYQAGSIRAFETIAVCKAQCDGCTKYHRVEYIVGIQLPTTPPTSCFLASNQFFQVKYFLRVSSWLMMDWDWGDSAGEKKNVVNMVRTSRRFNQLCLCQMNRFSRPNVIS